MKSTINGKWLSNMAFEADVSGHKLLMDASAESNGNDSGPRPQELMVAALLGCTGMDVVSILKKMRIEFDSLDISIESEMTEEHPKHYASMHVIYNIKGKNLPLDKIEKAVEMSQERYCGVSAVYKKAMSVTYEIRI